MRTLSLDVSKLLAYWGVVVVGAPNLYVHVWRGSDVWGGWDLVERGEGEMTVEVEREWVGVDGGDLLVVQRFWSKGVLDE